MSAQAGRSIVLNYRAQPAQAQAGRAVVLDAAAAGAARRVSARLSVPWARSVATRAATRAVMPGNIARDTATRAPWGRGQPQAATTRSAWGVSATADRSASAPWGVGQPLPPRGTAVAWGVSAPADRAATVPWGRYAGRAAAQAAPGWGHTRPADRVAVAPWGVALVIDRAVRAPHATARPVGALYVIPWAKFARPLNPGWGIVTPPNEPPTNEDGTVLVPILRSYIVVNNVTLQRVSNALNIPALSAEVRIDADSWGWGWSAVVPARHLDDLLPGAPGEPVELELQINGVVWRLLAERITRDRAHQRDRLNVSGRGIAAALADPLYPAESRDNTGDAADAQQLAAAALTLNGVPLGWALNWQAPDWLVPAGAWVHTGTPMDAVVRIAQACGAYVQADPALKTLHVLPRYPALPWEWSEETPDFILPSAATTRESTEFVERPPYNVVYVAGTDVGGILAQIKRAGTAGDLPAEMVVEPLATHADCARGRGAAILGDTGQKQILTLDTPVLDEIGLYPVGSLIDWTEGAATRRGLVRSVRVAAQLPRVRQTVEVECNG